MNSAISSLRDLPQYHTVNYNLKVEFANGRSIQLDNTAVNIPSGHAVPGARPADDRGGERTRSSACRCRRSKARSRSLPSRARPRCSRVNVPKLKYRPGETVKGT
jgi:hypothetical protein